MAVIAAVATVRAAWLMLGSLAWGVHTFATRTHTVHVTIPRTAIQVPAGLDPASFLPDETNAIVANCKRKRGRLQAYKSVPVRADGVTLGTFCLFGNLWGGCGLAWAEFWTGPANRPFASLNMKSVRISFRRVAPVPITSADDETWTPDQPENATWRDMWSPALRIERGAAFVAELVVVMDD